MKKELKRRELIYIFEKLNLDNIVDIIDEVKAVLTNYSFLSDSHYIISERKKILIEETIKVINGDVDSCKSNLLKNVNDRVRFAIRNIYEFIYDDSCSYYYLNETKKIENSSEISNLRNVDISYSKNDIVSSEEKNIIEDLIIKLEILYKNVNDKYINETKINNLERLSNYRKTLYEKPILKDLFLEVTTRCNARCEHCGSSCGDKIVKDEISAEYLKNTLLDISKKYNANEILLNVTGGEPLLRKDLFEIMEYATSLGFRWGMTSNGMLINDDILKKMEETKMETISISLDGMKETHENFRKVFNSFDKIIENIKKLQQVPTIKIVQVTTVANKKNLHELEEVYKLMKQLNVISWRVINVDPIGRAKENKDILLDSKDYIYLWNFIKEKREENILNVEYGCSHYLDLNYEKEIRDTYFICSAGLYVASILSNGDISVCPNVERRPQFIQGNIKNDNFVDIWENGFKIFRNENRTKCDKCSKCIKWKYCLGDSFHTWNFDDNRPNFCIKDILKEE